MILHNILRLRYVFAIAIFLLTSSLLAQSSYYFPEQGKPWKMVQPSSLGLDDEKIQSAIDFAIENEYSGPRDMRRAILKGFEREPFHEILGPTKKRGGPAGISLKMVI